MGSRWTVDMMEALTASRNESVAVVAAEYLRGDKTDDDINTYHGDFLKAVVKGDVWESWLYADDMNRVCLSRFMKKYGVYDGYG